MHGLCGTHCSCVIFGIGNDNEYYLQGSCKRRKQSSGVYTLPEYRGRGICTQIMKNLVEYGKKRKLSRIQLESTELGHSVYEKIGFEDSEHMFIPMEIEL